MINLLRWTFFLVVGIYFNILLMLLPLHGMHQWFRPQWMMMFVIFCQVKQPRYFNPLIACPLGLLLDVALGGQLGEHALTLSLLAYLTALLGGVFQARSLAMQCGKVFLLVCLGQMCLLWFHAIRGQNPHTLWYWMGAVTSCLCWPLFTFFFERCYRFFGGSAAVQKVR